MKEKSRGYEERKKKEERLRMEKEDEEERKRERGVCGRTEWMGRDWAKASQNL